MCAVEALTYDERLVMGIESVVHGLADLAELIKKKGGDEIHHHAKVVLKGSNVMLEDLMVAHCQRGTEDAEDRLNELCYLAIRAAGGYSCGP